MANYSVRLLLNAGLARSAALLALASCDAKTTQFAGSPRGAYIAAEPTTVSTPAVGAQVQSAAQQPAVEASTPPPVVDDVAAIEPTPIAVVPTPIAVEPTPIAVVPTPIAVEPTPIAVVPTPIAVEPTPIAVEPTPIAVEPTPIAVEPTPIAVEPTPIAVEPTPIVATPTPLPYVPANDSVLDACLNQQSWTNVFSQDVIAATPLKIVQASNVNNQVIWTDSVATGSPSLMRVKIDTLNANKGVIELLNPNGFYCVNYTGEVLNNFTIEVACTAQILVLDVYSRQSNSVNISRMCK